MAKPPGTEAPTRWMPYFLTADVDGLAEKAKELGAQISLEPVDVPTVGRLAILTDPTGAAFGLFRTAE